MYGVFLSSRYLGRYGAAGGKRDCKLDGCGLDLHLKKLFLFPRSGNNAMSDVLLNT